MRIKHILTAGLLAFVVVSLMVAIADVSGLRSPTSPTPSSDAEPSGDQWIAYYFHTSTRCTTCRSIEANTRVAVTPQVETGQVEWRVVNYEEPAHRHFATRFKLLCPSVVLVHARDGEPVRWKNLERVWELSDDRTAFVDYVRAEMVSFKEVRP